VCVSVGVREGGGAIPLHESVGRAAAEGRRAECACEAESELESVSMTVEFKRARLSFDSAI